jgi:hypothetical protein
MSQLNTATYPDLVANKDIIWVKGVMSVQKTAEESGIWKVDSWGSNTGDVREYSELELEEYAKTKDESSDAEQAKTTQGHSKTVSPIRFGLDISISWEYRNRNKYQTASRELTQLGRTVANRRELDLQHRIGFGTATTYTNLDGNSIDISTGDSLATFSTAHTLTQSSSTYRNILANNPQLSRGSLESMEQMIKENTLNNFGTKMTVTYDILWIADDANTENTAREILNSTASPAAPNSGVVNVNQGKYKLVVLKLVNTTALGAPDTDKNKYWGLAASGENGAQMYLSVEQQPILDMPTSLGTNAEEFSSEDISVRGRGSHAIVTVVGRGITLSKGNGDA